MTSFLRGVPKLKMPLILDRREYCYLAQYCFVIASGTMHFSSGSLFFITGMAESAEVKSGQPLSVQPGDDMILHLSQASLGEVKKDKGSEPVCLFVTIDGKKLVLGTLRSDEEIPLTIANNGKPEAKASAKDSAPAKQKVTVVEPSKGAKVDDSDESSDDDLSDDEDDSEMGEDDSDEDQSDESEEETPEKAETSKKRPADSSAKAPVLDKKKTKFTTPQKTDGKKGAVHVSTPHPSKQAGKTPGNKPNQTPKSGGSFACKTCNRTFGSENALESHSKAKHSAGK
ncbi:Histone deacetylase HDT1 [Capsicum annuum]|nr:Histone deacetylase HDT1 [Capsicum annuum]